MSHRLNFSLKGIVLVSPLFANIREKIKPPDVETPGTFSYLWYNQITKTTQYTIEIWEPINIPEVKGLYECSNHGRVKSLPRLKHTPHGGAFVSKEKILTQTKTYNGYLSVTLSNKPYNKSHFVHIITGTLHVKNPLNLKEINHKNGNKQCNYDWNLEWCTHSQNIRHALDTGLRIYKKKASL